MIPFADLISYAESGWRILPVDPETKAPLSKSGHKDATTDTDTIAEWWKTWPGANVGAAIPDNGLIVDLDPRNGCDVDQFLQRFDLPADKQLFVWSGRHDSGMHLYFTRPELPPGAQIRGQPADWPGVDIKTNGYVIVPPSTHPATRQPYEFGGTPARTIWAPVPPDLVDAITTHPAAPRMVAYRPPATSSNTPQWWARRLHGLTDTITEGHRNRGLYDALQCCQREGFPGPWEPILCDHAHAQGLEPGEIRATAASALGRSTTW